MSEMKPKRVLFQGDSTTDCGRDRQDPWSLGGGYPKFFVQQWLRNQADSDDAILFMNRGVGGDRTKDILNRFEEDVTALNPDVIFLLIGINDIWRAVDSNDPTDELTFRQQLTQIVSQMKALPSQPKLVMMEPFLLPNQLQYGPFRRLLDPAQEIIRSIARTYADLFIPLDGLLNARAINGPGAEALTGDGVHLSDEGNETVADIMVHYLLEETDGSIL